MIDDIRIEVWAAGLTVTFPLALSRRGVNRQGDLRVHLDDVEQGLRFFERLATHGSAAHVICLGEWSARDAGDWDNLIALEVLDDHDCGLLLEAHFDGADTEVVRYLSVEQAGILHKRIFWAVGTATAGRSDSRSCR